MYKKVDKASVSINDYSFSTNDGGVVKIINTIILIGTLIVVVDKVIKSLK